MEDPLRVPNDDPSDADVDAEVLQRRAEEAMEQMLLAQDDEEYAETENDGNDNNGDTFLEGDRVERPDGNDPMGVAAEGDENNGDVHGDAGFLDDDDFPNDNVDFPDSLEKKNPFTYVWVSCWAAIALIYYAYRSRRQWYMALVFLSSSKYSYVILGNAFIASLIWSFRVTIEFFLNGLRLNEAEGLADYFRWHITETCLALTIFRSELNVKTFVLFFVLIFVKCLHHIVDAREAHLRMTEEMVVANPTNGWMSLRYPHVKIFVLICMLQVVDIVVVVLCGQDIMKNGPSVSILFAFESVIMLTSVISNAMLWYIHLLDGILHFFHETSDASSRIHWWVYPWKDYKSTVVFAVELQAQAARFIFYLTFFSIVLTYYGLPINLIREVYISFLSLKSRMIAFNKYRQLMSSMNRFRSPTKEELEEDVICIICRDMMTVETAKCLPGCGHIFHKSCLREWLVQQQMCPTCRGDISAMEARQKQQDQMDARIQNEQQEQNQQQDAQEVEEELTNQEGIEGETIKEDHATSSAEENGEDKPTDGNSDLAPRSSPEVESDTDRKPRPRTNAISGHSQKTIFTKPKTNPTLASHRNVASSSNENPAFPAFYRVLRDAGASVYRDEEDNDLQKSCFLVTRVVPSGVVFLGTNMEYRKCVLANKMMIKMPDGWVIEDEVERIVAVPFRSSPSQ